MEGLPKDLLVRVSNLLETRDRARLALVCKELYEIVTST